MNNWGIREYIIALALLPILLAAIIMTSYFTMAQLNFISDAQTRHGSIIARQLAPVSEYGVFSGNLSSLGPILKSILADDDVVAIKITDATDTLLLSVSDDSQSLRDKSIWHQLAPEQLSTFKEPIITQPLDLGLPDDETLYNTDTRDEIIGYIELTLTSTNTNAEKLKTIARSSLITLLTLSISILLALRLGRHISGPVQTLTLAVKKISSGDYKTRINHQAAGDLGVLESCVNVMAKELQSSREDLEERIEESTRELQETMEELELRNAELDIARSNAILASKAKTEFLAHMSHELRTPLGGILGFAELLESTHLEVQQRDYSEIIKKSANSLLHIIDDVLDLSKIESGKLEINFSEFNIIDVVEEVIDLLIPTAYEKNIELYYYIDINTPHVINSDPSRLRQILINLVGNAVKFTEKGAVSLHISSRPEAGSFSQLIFSVTDSGIGMSPAHQERLFKAFSQADQSITRKFGGTGLGLMISKKLALLLNGDISFESQYNKGSTFTLSLHVEVGQQKLSPDPLLLDKTICLVDPQNTCIRPVQSMLELWGCKTSTHPQIPDDLSSYDLIIVNTCKTCLHADNLKSFLPGHKLDTPLLAIVSTRSHKELSDIRNYGFDDAVFHSAKHECIRQTVSKLINRELTSTEPAPPLSKNSFDWTGLNILVVDDNDINLKLAEIILHKNGAQVITASSGLLGVEQSNLKKFDLILMDLQMPDLDGYEAAKLIRENKKNADTIIIALTANALATKQSARIAQYGISAIMIKPVTEASIQNTLEKWLFNKNSQPEILQDSQKIEFFSKDEAIALAAGSAQLANELTSMLINELPEHLKIINDALSRNDIELLRKQAHKLHGATRCCGALALRNAAWQLESDIEHGLLENLSSGSHLLTTEIARLLNADHSKLII